MWPWVHPEPLNTSLNMNLGMQKAVSPGISKHFFVKSQIVNIVSFMRWSLLQLLNLAVIA